MIFKKFVDFKEVLKILARRSLEEKWYNCRLDEDEMRSDCAFCDFMNYIQKTGCGYCPLYQLVRVFWGGYPGTICDLVLGDINNNTPIRELLNIKENIIRWLEQLAERGEIYD